MMAADQQKSARPSPAPAPVAPPAGAAGAATERLEPAFVVRVVWLDSYMAAPLPGHDACWSELQRRRPDKVPVVRIFGSTPAGQRACLHLHGLLPYFYVPFPPGVDPGDEQGSQGLQFARRVGLALDAALAMSDAYHRRQQQEEQQGEGPPPGAGPEPPRCSYVYGAELVKGTSFYGFHEKESLWIKLLLYRPQDVNRAANLMLSGAVLGRPWQPHESHLPYLLKVKVDLNLYGMGWLRLADVKFRQPLPAFHARQRRGWAHQEIVVEQEELAAAPGNNLAPPHAGERAAAAAGAAGAAGAPSAAGGSQPMCIWTEATTPSALRWDSTGVRALPRASTCELELDARSEDVLNQLELVRLALADAGPEVRMVESLAPMWADEAQRCGSSGIPTRPASPPRAPKPLSAALGALRRQYEAVVAHQRMQGVAFPDSQDQRRAPTPQERAASRLLAVTQPANWATITSPRQGIASAGASMGMGAASGSSAGGLQQGAVDGGVAPEQAPRKKQVAPVEPDARDLVDEALLASQLAAHHRRQRQEQRLAARLQSQAMPGAATQAAQQRTASTQAGMASGEEGVEEEGLEEQQHAVAWLQRRQAAAEHGFASSDEEGEEGQALLLAMYARAMGLAQARPPAAGAVRVGGGGASEGNQPMSQLGQDEEVAQLGMRQFVTSSQQECEAIMAAAAEAREAEQMLAAGEEWEQHEEEQQEQQEMGDKRRAGSSSNGYDGDEEEDSIAMELGVGDPPRSTAEAAPSVPEAPAPAPGQVPVLLPAPAAVDAAEQHAPAGNAQEGSAEKGADAAGTRSPGQEQQGNRQQDQQRRQESRQQELILQVDGSADSPTHGTTGRVPHEPPLPAQQQLKQGQQQARASQRAGRGRMLSREEVRAGSQLLSAVRDALACASSSTASSGGHSSEREQPGTGGAAAPAAAEVSAHAHAHPEQGWQAPPQQEPGRGLGCVVQMMPGGSEQQEGMGVVRGGVLLAGPESRPACGRGPAADSDAGQDAPAMAAPPDAPPAAGECAVPMQLVAPTGVQQPVQLPQEAGGRTAGGGKHAVTFAPGVRLEDGGPPGGGRAAGRGRHAAAPALHAWIPRRPPPTRAELAGSMWERGLLPVVATQPHYGQLEGAREEVTMIAGMTFRNPTNAADELPPFISVVAAELAEAAEAAAAAAEAAAGAEAEERDEESGEESERESEGGEDAEDVEESEADRQEEAEEDEDDDFPSAFDRFEHAEIMRAGGIFEWGKAEVREKQSRRQQRRPHVWSCAKPPPARAATDAWLAARQRRRLRRQPQPATAGAGGPAFAMDPNTGKLLPATAVAASGKNAAEAGEGGLLDSPWLSAGGASTPATSASPSPSAAVATGAPAPADAAPAAAVAAAPSGGAATAPALAAPAALVDQEDESSSGTSSESGSESGTDEDEVCGASGGTRGARPPSPKYDESFAFFRAFINPFPSQHPGPALWRRRQRHQQLEQERQGFQQEPAGQVTAPAAGRQHGRQPVAVAGARPGAAKVPLPSRLGLQPSSAGKLGSGGQAQEPAAVADLPGAAALPEPPQQRRRASGKPRHSLLRTAVKGASAAAVTDPAFPAAGEAKQPPAKRARPAAPTAPALVAVEGGSPGGQQEQEPQQRGQDCGGCGDHEHGYAGQQRRVAFASPCEPLPPPGAPGPGSATGGPATSHKQRQKQFVSMVSPPSSGRGGKATPFSQGGFKHCIQGKGQQLTLLCLEMHADSRGALLPDPRHDAVRAVALALVDDDEEVPDHAFTARLLVFDDSPAAAAAAAAVGAAGLADDVAPGGERGPQGQPSAAEAAVADRAPSPRAASASGQAGDVDGSAGRQAWSALLPLASTAPSVPSLLATAAGAARVPPLLRNPAAMDALAGVQVDLYSSEEALLAAVVDAVLTSDPDIVIGFEVQQASLGYLADRASELGLPPFLPRLSRLVQHPLRQGQREGEGAGGPDDGEGEPWGGERGPGTNPAQAYGWNTGAGLAVKGRVVLNVWRLMRGEVKLPIYTLQSCAAAVLALRTPHFPQHQMADWFHGGPTGGRWRCLAHLVKQARLPLALLDRLDLVGRTGELARTFGIDFESVLTRGSQYRVESMMARLAHTQNYLLLSASREQVARQPAMECIPLVMEPESRLYTDPVVVLDFQSLYPSMIIAYNLCFSTCLGKPVHAREGAQLGASELELPAGTLGGPLAPERLLLAPNGVAFAPPAARLGVLPRLLREILDTRVMVKAAMKRLPPSARMLLRCLNARQFGLKLIANVTYGYTAAGFSGRMPMAELADAIVQLGRETLEAAIRQVEDDPRWRARVVYGDTDSLFVLLPGRTRAEAHVVGAEMAAAVTAANPSPVTLKMEKVYHPCVLQSKKRYVGFAFESPQQAKPAFDAKGIETVRRDTCPAVSKMLERTLRILFATKDLTQVREYLETQWTKILGGRVSVADFVFAKEVRLGTYSPNASVLPPAALVATRAAEADPRAVPRYGERVRYVVVHGQPEARLADMVMAPSALVEAGGRLSLHAYYYITRQIIPAIERVLSLVGADARAWFARMPRPNRALPQKRPVEAAPAPTEGGAQEASGQPQIGVSQVPAATHVVGSCTTNASHGPVAAGSASTPPCPASSPAGGAGAATVPLCAAAGQSPRQPAPHAAVSPRTGGCARDGVVGSAAAAGSPSMRATAVAAPLSPMARAKVAAAAAAEAEVDATVDLFYLSHFCPVCEAPLEPMQLTCNACRAEPQLAVAVLAARWSGQEARYCQLAHVCRQCGGGGRVHFAGDGGIACDSLDCGVYFERRKAWHELRAAARLGETALEALDGRHHGPG